ncbi:hypothetical protein SAMN07250955_103314 [Arboricoccus pini]|uniref:Uncharacterized protein n=1 Tax=Arboricoccus pini TaxID=1963835 RepID=A0A212QUI2_9PROT|nr:hypothetical protein [Arboricoccus pini]SNB63351.1 hypothetical protein SAMN07250955_103314 [Arboricoccus pini]
MDRFLGLIKVFIVVAGLCLVLGTGALVWKLFNRGGDPSVTTTTAAVETTQPVAGASEPAPAGSSDTEVHAAMPVPKGAVVIDMRMQGNRALLLLRTPDGDDYLSLIDPATGRRYSLIRMQQEDGSMGQLATPLRQSP